MNPWLHPVIFIKFLVEADDAVDDSEFQKLDEFICQDLADIGEIGAGRIWQYCMLLCHKLKLWDT